jgi:hypothetical protein
MARLMYRSSAVQKCASSQFDLIRLKSLRGQCLSSALEKNFAACLFTLLRPGTGAVQLNRNGFQADVGSAAGFDAGDFAEESP